MNESIKQQKYDNYLLNTPRWQEPLVSLENCKKFCELYSLCLQQPTDENFQKMSDLAEFQWIKQYDQYLEEQLKINGLVSPIFPEPDEESLLEAIAVIDAELAKIT